jgi:hypothetical protein
VTSKLIRKIHLYLALFFGPWVLMYAVSTFVMNHRVFFRGETPPPPTWETVSTGTYRGDFPPDAAAAHMAQQLLASLGLDGAHQASLRDGRLVVNRFNTLRPLRVSFAVHDGSYAVERQAWETEAFLERMHRRRGFQSDYFIEDVWAFGVDVFIVAVLFWTLSGLWLWWEMRPTRTTGAMFAAGGTLLFAFFLAVL